MKHIYWGLGKGKTSALNGSALRAKGAGLNVAVFKFLKGSEKPSSEDAQLEKLGIKVMNAQEQSQFVLYMSPEEKLRARDQTLSVMKFITMNQSKYDMVILDEFLDLAAKNVNFLTEGQMNEFLDSLKCEVLISGHTSLSKVFERADLITEFIPTKHYFDKGVKARKGIEY